MREQRQWICQRKDTILLIHFNNSTSSLYSIGRWWLVADIVDITVLVWATRINKMLVIFFFQISPRIRSQVIHYYAKK
jgi:hypothetical protein